ncbi:GPR1/FUN34/YaaH family transporter [Pseudonocardia pini]|uniref:GPR1/FUN34/YaaH family transporter n=1 Tax=Pseudonocardia pini TaxID=2758030 RepID=UPI0015F085C3|nr:GPR1/FUN34/YaaH family transporter [Pseudonocardia pini]
MSTEHISPEHIESTVAPAPVEAAPAAPTGNPALLGLPAFLVGGIGLTLYLIGYLPAAAVGTLVPMTLTVAGLGLLVAGWWAIRIGQGAVGAIFTVFATFWLSYAYLVLSLVNDWLKIPADSVATAQATFLIAWLAVFAVLTLATLRLPMAFTALFTLVTVTVALVLVATLTGSAGLLIVAGVGAALFCLVAIYIFVDGMTQELGGPARSMGTPLVH